MAGITQTQAETQLALWLNALTAIASGQEYAIAGRSLKYADLKAVQDMVNYWDSKIKSLARGGIVFRQGAPTFES